MDVWLWAEAEQTSEQGTWASAYMRRHGHGDMCVRVRQDHKGGPYRHAELDRDGLLLLALRLWRFRLFILVKVADIWLVV